jgi:Divergent InlB B-repeat domain
LGPALVAVLLVGLAGPIFATISMVGTRPAVAAPLAPDQIGQDCYAYPCYTLTVSLGGNGSGIWQTTNSSFVADGIINCQMVNGVVTAGSVCSHKYGGEARVTPITIRYKLTPAAGSALCLNSGYSCDNDYPNVTMTLIADTTLVNAFKLLSYTVTITKSGTGTGTVTWGPPLIFCGSACSATFLYGSEVGFNAMPDPGSSFSGWTGGCAGEDATCSLEVPVGGLTTNAIFNLPVATPTPTARPTATPTARPTAAPTKPPSTPKPNPTAAPTAPPPGVTAPPITPTTAPGSTAGPTATADPAATLEASPTAQASASQIALVSPSLGGDPTPVPSIVNVVPTVVPATDFTPIAIAILGAGLLIALGIGAAGFALRGRRGAGPG